MQLDHQLRCGSGPLVQLVDVLGEQGPQPARPFQVDQCAVGGVRFGPPGGVLGSGPPGTTAHLGVLHVGLQGEQLPR